MTRLWGAGSWDTNLKLPTQQGLCQGRLQLPLDGTLDWPGTIHWVVPDACQVPARDSINQSRQHGFSDQNMSPCRGTAQECSKDPTPSPEVDVMQGVLVCCAACCAVLCWQMCAITGLT